jgi:hypothetical protein
MRSLTGSGRSTSAILTLLPTLLFALPAQDPAWRTLGPPIVPTGPGALVYDDLRDRTIFFGGGQGYVPFDHLLELDGDIWTPVPRTSPWPPARFWPAMAYDSRRGEVVMQGGAVIGPTFFPETWRWNGAAWSLATTTTAPPPMVAHAMSYDEGRDRIVLFGGTTWEWDGSDWSQCTPALSPPPRGSHAMAYDARRARTVLFGGSQSTTNLSDTWEWDGATWQQVATTGVQPVAIQPAMAFDRERGRCVLVGQQVGGASSAHEFDGTVWTPVAPLATPGTGHLTYDRQRGRAVFFATAQTGPSAGRTWAYDTAGLAVAQPYGVACGSPALRAREDANARPVLGATFGVDVLDIPSGLAFMCFGWSNRQVLGLDLPASMAPFGLPGCWILQSDDAITLPCAPTGATTARFSMAIPSDSSFTGLRFFLQPWAPAPGMFPPIDAVVGNGVAVTLGAF